MKNSNPLTAVSLWRCIIFFFSQRQLKKPILRFLVSVNRRFFLPQFATKLRLNKTPVVNVDHPLDNRIVFSSTKVKIYMQFTQLWLKSLYLFHRHFGDRTLPEISRFIDDLNRLYHRAGDIYDQIRSTTWRPPPALNLNFLLIHLFDPHLHCVPSLHVVVCAFTWSRLQKYSAEIQSDTDQNKEWQQTLDNIFLLTVEIIDSILFVKQHSINCVAAGIYFLQANDSDFAASNAGALYLRQLLSHQDQQTITADLAQTIREKVSEIYLALLDKSEPKELSSGQCRKRLLKFLTEYDPAKTQQTDNIRF